MYSFLILVHTYARFNLKADAGKTYLSYLWWILEPLLFVIAFYFVFVVILDNGRADYIAFLVCGKIPFLWFSKAVNGAAGSIIQNKGLLTHSAVRPELFPCVDFHQSAIKQVVAIAAMLLFLIVGGYSVGLSWLWLPVLFLVQYIFMLSFALMAAYFTSFVPDVRMLIGMFTLMVLFSSGIFWDINMIDEPVRSQLLIWNPMAFLIDAYRQTLMYGNSPNITHLLGLTIVSLAAIAAAVLLYRVSRRHITAKVLHS